eukprot:CAMPEP_0119546280 /NCGR_PEP_ID=MMETSP1352-20130426/773_1 /TAXON_ID=265584 /ORGANISM="Stauroneis constricta, Strain CCMP1120" /LENGTH=389 /DNA_ID=CAMNT_0007590969 /DNA_START=224 /DNA_END=1390 /DNA_ORIENTATION=+
MLNNTDDDFTIVSAVSSFDEEGKDWSNTIAIANANANTSTDATKGIVIGGVPPHAQRTSNNEDSSSVAGVKSGESRTCNHGPTMPRRWKSDTRPRLLVDEIDMYSHHGRSVASIKSNHMPPAEIAMDSDDDDDDKDDDASSVTSVGSEAFKRASKTMRDENEKFERASRRFERELLEYNRAKDAHYKAVRTFQASLASRVTNKVEDGGSDGSTDLGRSVVVVDDEAKVVEANESTSATNDGAQSLSVRAHHIRRSKRDYKSSLPREIELSDDEMETEESTGVFNDTQFVSNRRIADGAQSSSVHAHIRRSKRDYKSSLPREIELSDDETEADKSTDAFNDTQFVSDRRIVDPYGEAGIYSGALSKSTDMPNGKGRLEYERAGRWYHGDW